MFEDAHMDETLTMEEIKARYAPDWVLIAEPETDDMQRLLRGKVVCRGPDGDELLRKATELKLDHIAVRYLGEWPEDSATPELVMAHIGFQGVTRQVSP